MLPLNTQVRIKLSQPKDYKERNIIGHFRAGDLRWSQDIYKVIGYVLDPHQPILYKLNQKLKKHELVAYTRNQLQVVESNEGDVSASKLGVNIPAGGEFAIKKFIDKRTRGNKTEYLVHWRGYPLAEASWVYKSKIPKSFVEFYEEENIYPRI
jgi:hypothetical protein